MDNIPAVIRATIAARPEVAPHLSDLARYIAAGEAEFKTYDYFLSTLTRMVRTVYDGYLAGEFVDILASLLNGQINQAYRKAWDDEGRAGEPIPAYLTSAAEEMVLQQFDYVDGYFRDIVTARLDKTPVEPLLVRAQLWANQWNNAYNDGLRLIALENGGKMVWRYGDTEHCDTCARLNGIVAFAKEWEASGFRPQSAPNNALECGGWRCKCRLEPTDARRSPKALDALLNIRVSRGL